VYFGKNPAHQENTPESPLQYCASDNRYKVAVSTKITGNKSKTRQKGT
jgi:hypothetical protein